MKNGPKFLISDARTAFNRLRLAFTEAQFFDIVIWNAIFGLRLMHWAILSVGC